MANGYPTIHSDDSQATTFQDLQLDDVFIVPTSPLSKGPRLYVKITNKEAILLDPDVPLIDGFLKLRDFPSEGVV